MFKPRYETSKWLENITRGLVTEAVFRVWLDCNISSKLGKNHHIINLCIFNPPHSYHPFLKNPFFKVIGDAPDFAIAHVESLNGEYGKGLLGLYQYDRLDVIMDIKCERGFHPASTSGICERNCERFKECVTNNEQRGWFPESQVNQFNTFYTLLSKLKPKLGLIAWFPLPTMDKITEEVVRSNFVKHSYACAVLGSDFLKGNGFFKIFEKHVKWDLLNKNIRWICLDDEGNPQFQDSLKVSSERGRYNNICFNLSKAMTTSELIELINKKASDILST